MQGRSLISLVQLKISDILMSKWTLLRAAISGKIDDKNESRDVSIHRFSGFTVIPRRKIIWQGFQLNVIIEPGNLHEIAIAPMSGECDDPSTCDTSLATCPADETLQSRSLKCLHRLEEFVKHSYEFMSAVDCTECLLVINLIDSHSEIEKLKEALLDYEANNYFRRQSSMEEFAEEHSATFPPPEEKERVMRFRGAYYIRNLSLELSTSCQYFAYDLPMSFEEEKVLNKGAGSQEKALKEEEGSQEVHHQSILSVRPPLSSSTVGVEAKIVSLAETFSNTKKTHRTTSKNRNAPDIMKNNNSDSTREITDETFDVNEVLDSPYSIEDKSLKSESEPGSDDRIVYRMSRIFTREESQSRKVTGKGLLSHLIHGVDNTGKFQLYCIPLCTVLYRIELCCTCIFQYFSYVLIVSVHFNMVSPSKCFFCS